MADDYSDTLYVIFHGAWAFVENEADVTCFHAYAPDIEEHVYMGGSWLGEIKILPGSILRLSPGQIPDEPYETLRDSHTEDFVIFPKRIATPAAAYTHVILPRPRKIYSEMVVNGVGVTTADEQTPTSNLGLVPVFEYDLTAIDPALYSFPDGERFWTAPAPNPDATSKATTLHLFAADDSKDRTHASNDFAEVASLLGYVAFLGKPDSTSQAGNDIQTPGLQGARSYEITTFLYQRVNWLRQYGYQMEAAGPGGGAPSPDLVPFTLVAADTSSCGGGGGGS